MIVAGVVVQTVPSRASAVAHRLSALPGFEVKNTDGDSRIAAVWTGESGEDLEALGEGLVAEDWDILGVFPTFAADVGSENGGSSPVRTEVD